MFWESHLCRICGLVDEASYPIFGKDVNSELELKLKKYLNLNVLRDDFKPKEVCNPCILKLESYVEFCNLCYVTNEKFESILFHTQQKLIKKEFYNPISKNSVIVASGKDEQEQFMNSDLPVISQYKDDMLMEQNLNVPCSLNDHDVLNMVSTNGYAAQVQVDVAFVSNKSSEYDINGTILDPSKCGKSNMAKNMNELNFSTIIDVEGSTETERSKGVYLIRNDNNCLQFQNNEAKEIPYDCSCLKINTVQAVPVNIENVINPERLSKNGKKPKCNQQSLVNVDFIANTMKLPSRSVIDKQNDAKKVANTKSQKNIRFTCNHCNKSFSRKRNLSAHLAVHTNLKPYLCEICDKSFVLRWDLTCHQRIHTDLYRCNHCLKSFSVPSKLERHLRIHKNERPYMCDVEGCGKTFSDKRNLVGHQSVHSDLRKFICIICDKSYKTKSQLKDHQRAHNSEASFKCNICSKSYTWKASLLLHIRKHSAYKCLVCKKDCEKLSMLIKHRKECKNPSQV